MMVGKDCGKEARVKTEHVTVCRPWGSYTVLEETAEYKVKKVTIKPRKRLSLQYHHKRGEHWVVVRGKALIKVGSAEFTLYPDQSIYVPCKAIHRLSNPFGVTLEIIEVQHGAYLGEDDIVRIDDDFGRRK